MCPEPPVKVSPSPPQPQVSTTRRLFARLARRLSLCQVRPACCWCWCFRCCGAGRASARPTRKRCAPVGQHAHEAASSDVILHHVFGKKPYPQPCPRRTHARPQRIEDQLPFDVHVYLARPLLKFPGIDASARRQPQIDAAVALQILWCARHALSLEVARRRHDRHPKVRPHPHCDHVLGDLFTQSDTGVEVLRNNIAETVIQGQLDPDVRVLWKEMLQPRQHDPLGDFRHEDQAISRVGTHLRWDAGGAEGDDDYSGLDPAASFLALTPR